MRAGNDAITPALGRAESAIRHREASHRQSRCGAGRQAHWLDERHQDLIHDLGEQLIGSR
jgi:hypothetical protein